MLTISRMTKIEAISLFGTVKELALAIKVTRHAVYQWPDELPQPTTDRVMGAAYRLGKLKDEKNEAAA